MNDRWTFLVIKNVKFLNKTNYYNIYDILFLLHLRINLPHIQVMCAWQTAGPLWNSWAIHVK